MLPLYSSSRYYSLSHSHTLKHYIHTHMYTHTYTHTNLQTHTHTNTHTHTHTCTQDLHRFFRSFSVGFSILVLDYALQIIGSYDINHTTQCPPGININPQYIRKKQEPVNEHNPNLNPYPNPNPIPSSPFESVHESKAAQISSCLSLQHQFNYLGD